MSVGKGFDFAFREMKKSRFLGRDPLTRQLMRDYVVLRTS